MLTIYDSNHTRRFDTPINKGSKRVFKLMGDDYVTLKFSVKTPVNFDLGDFCDIPGFGRFELCKPYKPTYNKSTGGYDYELMLESQHMKWRNKIMRYLPMTGGSETSWTLTATAQTHMEQVLQNVKALAAEKMPDGTTRLHPNYNYNGTTPYIVVVHPDVEVSAKTITYDSTNIIDALTAIAEAFECEWWLNGNIINLGKCERENDYIDLEIGRNVAEMSHSNSSEEYVTRILAFGSDRNISPRYRKDLIFNVTETRNGGNEISDGTRPLNGEWLEVASSQIQAASTDSIDLSFANAGNYNASSTGGGETLITTRTQNHGRVKAGEWKILLSQFKPKLTFNNQVGSRNGARVVIRFNGITDGSNSQFQAQYESSIYIYSTGAEITASFQDQTIDIPADLSSLSVTVDYYITLGTNSSMQVAINSMSNGRIKLANTIPNYKVSGVTIERIDSSGNVVNTFTGAIYNPQLAESQLERNWIKLPSGAVMSVGDRYRIVNIRKSKVKSSYFTSRYAAYDNMANVVTNGIVTSRLMLPESYGSPYVDYKEGLSMEQGVEDVVVFEDVYPRAVCRIINVDTIDRKETVQNDDRTSTDKKFTAFKVMDSFFTSAHPFSSDYIIPGKTLEVTFQDGYRYTQDDIDRGTLDDGTPIRATAAYDGEVIGVGSLHNPGSGKLNGWTFEVGFTKADDGSAIWEIVRDNNSYVPNDILRPEIGDQFVLVGFDTAAVNDLYIDAAEQELLHRAQKYLEKINTDPSTYDCTMMPDVMKAGLNLELGTRVNLINDAFIPTTTDDNNKVWGRKSRIIGYEIPLDIPYDNPIYTVGEKAAYSRLGAIEDSVDALQYSMANPVTVLGGVSTQIGNGTPIYVIGQTDSTPATDTNVFSALRSRLEFVSKRAAEIINNIWTFAQGLFVGNYIPNNSGAKIDANGDAEFGNVKARGNLDVGGNVSVEDAIEVRNGITIGNGYVPGSHGGKMWMDEAGEIHIETDYLDVRKKLQAKEIEIQEETHVGGYQIISPAAMRCERVIPIRNEANSIVAYKCCFATNDSDGNVIYNQFSVSDLARCETFNLERQANGSFGNHYYWRLVTEVGYIQQGDADYDPDFGREGYIVLSNINGEKDNASDAPLVGDRIITMGNMDAAKADRQNLIILASYGSGSPFIYQYQGINAFALNKSNLKVAISPNGNLFTGKLVIENSGTETDIVDYIEDNIYLEAYQLILSNEMAGVACDSDGNPLGDLPSTTVQVYKGRSPEIGWSFSLDCFGCVATQVGNAIYLSALTEKTATVTITATKADCPTLVKVMTIVKLSEGEVGAQGEHAVEFQIEPDTSMVLVDMDGNCDPENLACKVYMVIGNKTRVEVPTAGNVPTTTFMAGDNLLFFNGKLFVDRPVEVGIPTDLILRYIIINQDFSEDEETGEVITTTTAETERIYTRALQTTSRMKAIIFKLYRGETLVDMQTVVAQVDTAAMRAVYETRFTQDERAIEAVATRTTKTEEDIADLKITAEEISSTVGRTSGIVNDIINGAGRNLLLKTNQGTTNWNASHDGSSNFSLVEEDNGFVTFQTSLHNDCTYARFFFHLRPELIKSGEKYTVSFLAKETDATNAIQLYAQIANVDETSPLTDKVPLDPMIYRGTYRTKATLTASASGAKNGSQYLIISVADISLAKFLALTFGNLKLEKGETATSYYPAPEDREDYLYSELQSQIVQTAESITATLRAEYQDADGSITEAYTSLVELTAQSIRTEVTDLQTNLQSQIEQTASSISMRVDILEGTRNLVTGNRTGIGWALTKETDGSFGTVTPYPATGAYIFNTMNAYPRMLRTPLFALKANTKYTLSFAASGSSMGTGGALLPVNLRYGVYYGDAATPLFDAQNAQINLTQVNPVGTTSDGRIKYTFTTGSDPIDGAFVEFVLTSANRSATIRRVMVEEGEVAHPYVDDYSGLLATGIDIENRRIVFTSDNIIFQTNSGEQSMFIDENGKIFAKFINAEELEVCSLTTTGSDQGHIEINTQRAQNRIAIFDEDDEEVTTFNGARKVRGISDIFGSTQDTYVNLYTSSGENCVAKGTLEVRASSSGDLTTLSPNPTILYSDPWQADTPPCVVFNGGKIYCEAYSAGYTSQSNGGAGQNGDTIMPFEDLQVSYAEVSVNLFIEVADDENFTQNVKSSYIAYAGINANASGQAPELGWTDGIDGGGSGTYHRPDNPSPTTTMLTNKSAKVPKKGWCRVKMMISLKAKHSGSYAKVRWGADAPSGANLSAICKYEYYTSNFFANGFCLGTQNNKYVIVYKDASDNMNLIMEDSGFGLKLGAGLFQYKHNNGNWLEVPKLVYKGTIYFNSSDKTYSQSSYISYNGQQLKSISRLNNLAKTDGMGYVRLYYSDSWTGLSLGGSSTIVRVFGMSSDSKGRLMKTSIAAIASTYVDIEISDDASSNDGDFIIEIWKM